MSKDIVREYKTLPAFSWIKEAEDEEKATEDLGIVTHLISVYGVEDQGQDVAHKGMFTKTIKERGNRIRVLDSHNRASVKSVVGVPIQLYEVGRDELPPEVLQKYPEANGGLMAETQYLMDTPEGKGVFIRIKNGAVSEFSFGYDTVQADYEDVKIGNRTKKRRHLREVRLWEYGPVIFGMNDAAISVDAKSDSNGESTDDADTNTKQLEVMIESQKAIGRMREMETIYDAFSTFQYQNRKDGDSSEPYYGIVDAYDDHVLVQTYGKSGYYKVPFTETDDGGYNFASKEDWILGTLEFVATEVPSDDDSDKAAELEAERKLIEEQLAEWDESKAGPEQKEDADTSDQNEMPPTLTEEEKLKLLLEIETI